jgi:hypothetical protein
MAGSFEGIYKDDEIGGGETSMMNAMGSAGETKGTELESPEDNFPGHSMSPGALGDPGNALPSVTMSKPSSDGSFDCMADNVPKIGGGSKDNL